METENRRFGGLNLGPWFIAIAALLWTTDTLVRTNLKGLVTSTQIVLIDHVIIILVISPLVIKHAPKLKGFNMKEWGALLFIGIGGSALATIALTEGFFTGSFPFQFVAIVILLQQTQPLIAITFAHLFLKEKLPAFFYRLAFLALIGIFLIIFPYFYDVETGKLGILDLADNVGLVAGLLGLTAAFFWGTSTVFGRYLLKHSQLKLNFSEMATYRFLIATVFLLIFIPFLPRSGGYPTISTLIDPVIIVSILYLAIVVGLLALLFYYYGLKTTHASVSTIMELAYPLSFFVLIPIFKLTMPEPIQLLGGLILIVATTTLSYLYGKLDIDLELPEKQAYPA
jgi:drug/metabolite transporter (DMT)-like permease